MDSFLISFSSIYWHNFPERIIVNIVLIMTETNNNKPWKENNSGKFITPTVAGIKNNGKNASINPAPSLMRASGIIFNNNKIKSNSNPTIDPGKLIPNNSTVSVPINENKNKMAIWKMILIYLDSIIFLKIVLLILTPPNLYE